MSRVNNPGLGHKAHLDGVLRIQGQLSPLCLSQQCFAELSGWSNSCIHVRNPCLAYSQPLVPPTPYRVPSQVHTLLLEYVLSISSPSLLVSMSEGTRRALPYPSDCFISKFEKITKHYGGITKRFRKNGQSPTILPPS